MKDYAKIVSQAPRNEARISQKVAAKPTLAGAAIQKNKEAAQDKSTRKWLYALVLLIILIICFSAYREKSKHSTHNLSKKEQAALQLATAQADQNGPPQFDFYTTLPDGKNLGVSGSSGTDLPPPSGPAPLAPDFNTGITNTETASIPAPAGTTLEQPKPSGKYYLSAGSFSNSADAQQMLSQLLLLGINVNIENGQDNGQAAYQVVVGPFDDEETMKVVKQQLDAHQISATVFEK